MNSPKRSARRRARNLSLAAVAAQAGCWTVIIVFTALILGLWLDARSGVRGPFTIGLLIISVPISLLVMLRIALSAIERIDPPELTETKRDSS
jgi:MFS family permease